MSVRSLCILSSLLFCFISSLHAQNKAYDLLTDLRSATEITAEDGHSGKGLSRYPYFSWIVEGTQQRTKQIAYHIIVSDDRQLAAQGKGNIRDSGKVRGSTYETKVSFSRYVATLNGIYMIRLFCSTNISNLLMA